jgi:putative transposase
VQTYILQRLREMPGIPLSALGYDGSGIRPNDIYAMLAQYLIYTDLYAAPLIKHGRIRLYLSEDQARAYAHLQPTALVSRVGSPLPEMATELPTNTTLLWDGRGFMLVNPGETTTTLLPEKGPPLQIPSTFFFHLLETGEITRLRLEGDPPATAPEVDQLLDRATPADQRQANERFVMVNAYLQGEKDKCATVAPRTLYRWVARYREAEARWGCGYAGLLTRKAQQGNHAPKAPEASRCCAVPRGNDHPSSVGSDASDHHAGRARTRWLYLSADLWPDWCRKNAHDSVSSARDSGEGFTCFFLCLPGPDHLG